MQRALIYCLLYLMLYGNQIHGQEVRHLNGNNGLRSNHVYRLLFDKHGYLWIATDKGVYQYNGYDLRGYTLSNGLYNEDIWDLYPDKKGRLWLSSIFDQLAYIRNNEIRHAVLNTHKTIYPRHLIDYDEGIAFLTPYHHKTATSLCIERNDSIYAFDLSEFRGQLFLQDGNTLVNCQNDTFYKIQYTVNGNSLNLQRDFLWYQRGSYNLLLQTPVYFFYGNSLVCCKTTDSILYAFNFNRQNVSRISFGSRLSYAFLENNSVYAITGSSIYKLDTSLKIQESYKATELTIGKTLPANDCSYFINDRFWGQCLATFANGVFINNYQDGEYKQVLILDFQEYRFVGMLNDTIGCWWNKKGRVLVTISQNNIIESFPRVPLDNIEYVTQFDNKHALVMNKDKLSLFNYSSKNFSNLYKGFKVIRAYPPSTFDTIVSAGGFNAHINNNSDFYLLSRSTGFAHLKRQDSALFVSVLDHDRYDGMTYDSFRQSFWVYKADYIANYKGDRLQFEITNQLLQKFGIRNIKQILADRHGNIFIKEYHRIFLYNPLKQTVRPIFKDYVLENAIVRLQGDILVICGRFGILYSEVTGPGKVSRPLVFNNPKGLLYSNVTDMQVCGKSVLVNTDKGLFTTMIPDAKRMFVARVNNAGSYNLIGQYNGDIHNLTNRDTISIEQRNTRIKFDIINPSGSGRLKYLCRISEAGITERDNDLNLSGLIPGKMYQITLNVEDDIWRSSTLTFRLIIKPYWWQTVEVQKIMWTAGALLVILILLGIVYITRIVVVKSHTKRNIQLELELKAIHAQINPHFIYNTLSVTQYFISNNRLNEALAHIHKFSKLLRAYVHSSRTRVITVAEEIKNLTNYIELQQTRFQNKFGYEIIIADDIDVDTTIIPSLLLQPIVENAINHGLFHKKNGGLLRLQFDKTDNGNALIIVIEDNGIGRIGPASVNKLSDKKSYGSELIKDLVGIFNKYENMHIGIEYSDKRAPDTGTIVRIKISHHVG